MDGSDSDVSVMARSDDLPVRRFALRVVSELVRVNEIRTGAPKKALLDLVVRYARTGEVAYLDGLHAEMGRRNVPAAEVMDIYMPQAVQQLGADWHDDQIDILQASLGFARLQTLLRELGRAWSSDGMGHVSSGRVLLLLPRAEQHTLGAMFAANQLRRLGVSVKVMLVPDIALLSELLQVHKFDGIFISVSNKAAIQTSGDLVSDLRARNPNKTPIVIGGGLVSGEIDANALARIATMTGADIVTNDIPKALHSCGLQQCSAAAE